MRAYLGSITKTLRHGRRAVPHEQPAVPRSLRPRLTRATYIPLRDEDALRGLGRAA